MTERRISTAISSRIAATAKTTATVPHITAIEIVPGLPDLAGIRLETTDLFGNPISSVTEGDTFELRAYAQDLRNVPAGAFAAYLDVVYSSTQVALAGPVVFGPTFLNGQSVDTSAPGLIDEVGAFVIDFNAPGTAESLLFSVTLTATSAGTATFTSDPAEEMPEHDSLLFGDSNSTGAPILTGAPWQNPADPKDVNGDGAVSPIDYLTLLNDINISGSRPLSNPPDPLPPPFLDVSGDGFVSPYDGVLILDMLAGEGSEDPVPTSRIDYGSTSIDILAAADVVEIHLQTTDLFGNPISQVTQGEDFLVRVAVEDVRAVPEGVFAASLDMLYDSPLVCGRLASPASRSVRCVDGCEL